MGRSLGYFDSDELDRPELNKCPDCECYFASEECPLCGKICPENFRAGNRAPVKKPKKKKNSSGRVQFIPWYHSWLFIIIMLFIQPVIGIILFFTSPYSAKAKITTAALVIGGGLLYGRKPEEISCAVGANDVPLRGNDVALCANDVAPLEPMMLPLRGK